MTKYVISMDPGKDSTKAVGMEIAKGMDAKNAKRVKFRSRAYDLSNGYIDIDDDNSHKVVFDNKIYIVGDQGGVKRSYSTSKQDPLHQLCSYVAITQFLQPNTKNQVYLVLACPVSMLEDDNTKAEYKQFIKGDGVINIEVDGAAYEFEIVDILLKAEGSGILYLANTEFKGKKVAVVDFGGLNMTFTLFQNGSCIDPETHRFAEDFGGIQLVNSVARKLTAYNKGNIVKFETAEGDLFRGYSLDYGSRDTKSIEYIDSAKEDFFRKACAEISRRGITLSDLDRVIFVGGTTQHLANNIAKELPNHLVVDGGQWTNADGLFVIALKKYGSVK